MAGHGGARPGAGAPQRGVNYARRRLLAAIEGGVEIAGRQKGLTGDRESVIVETAAHMVADMIDAGDLKEVFVLWGQVSAKADDEGDEDGKKSTLSSALLQASRALHAGNAPDSGNTSAPPADNPPDKDEGATHPQCAGGIVRTPGQPVFIPQANLPLLINNAEPAQGSRAPAGTSAPGAGTAPRQEGAPTPTPRAPTPTIGVDGKNFENFREDLEEEGSDATSC